ncbi:MAG: hypothetical protein KCHDKBKB_01833 [Elusimicrobia bacterium]|nr:hypothetical protein [Elusimicrobiota bacterium]
MACILGLIAFNATSIQTFPPVNADDVSNAILGDHYGLTGEIRYPLMKNVVHPDFYDLSSSDQYAYRGIYTLFTAFGQRLIGKSFFQHRLFSFIGWVLIGLLMACFLAKNWGPNTAIIGSILWYGNLCGILASHLIRPDIWLAFFATIQLILIPYIHKRPHLGFFFFAMAGPIAMGFHPHGILLIAWSLLIFSHFLFKQGNLEGFWGFVLGLLSGVAIYALYVDVETAAISKFTYAMAIHKSNFGTWLTRLNPLTWIKDTFLLFIFPDSFYLPSILRLSLIWYWSFNSFLLVFILASIYLIWNKKMNRLLWSVFSLWAVLFSGMGFGYIRREAIYILPIIVSIIPIITWFMTTLYKDKKPILLFLTSCILLSSVLSTIVQTSFASQHCPPITQSFSKTEEIIGTKKQRIMGPAYFWFMFGNELLDIEGLEIDYFYSLRIRTAEIMNRSKPDIVITDLYVRRRFPFIDQWLTQNASLIGIIPENPNHGELRFYRFSWKEPVSEKTL